VPNHCQEIVENLLYLYSYLKSEKEKSSYTLAYKD
jgi:hypothetical protein